LGFDPSVITETVPLSYRIRRAAKSGSKTIASAMLPAEKASSISFVEWQLLYHDKIA
jgi:hypothetical protein